MFNCVIYNLVLCIQFNSTGYCTFCAYILLYMIYGETMRIYICSLLDVVTLDNCPWTVLIYPRAHNVPDPVPKSVAVC